MRRLKQVATTLNIGTSTIVDFLYTRGYDIENKPTARINEEQFNLLMHEFSASLLDKIEASELNVYQKPGANPDSLDVSTKLQNGSTEYVVDYFVDGETPEVLYKYRCWSNESKYHKRLINNNELFFSSPTAFNDPFDVNIPFRLDLLNKSEHRQYCLELASQVFPYLNGKELNKKAKEIETSGSLSVNNIRDSNIKILNEFRKNVGIVSLSKNKCNILMWSHYSDSHKGICIGFDTKELLKQVNCRLEKVDYSEEYPVLKNVLNPVESIKQLVTKSTHWKYEEEYRLIKGYYPNKALILTDDVYKEIVLGCQMPNNDKLELAKTFRKKFKNVKVLEAVQDQNRFSLSFKEI